MKRYWVYSLVLTAVAFAATLVLYSRLPEQMPTHWNISGKPDAWGDKSWAAFLAPMIMLGTVILGFVLRWASPRNFEVDRFGPTYAYVLFTIVAFAGYMQAVILWATLGQVQVDRAIVGGVLVLFTLLGNVMGKLKRNFWMGIRTPWTLADEKVWNQTHRFGAKVYVATGISGLLLLVAGVASGFLMVWLLVGAMAPVPYSLWLSKKGSGSGWTGTIALTAGVLALAIFLGGITYYSLPGTVRLTDEMKAVSVGLVENLSEGRYEQAEEHFDSAMRQALPPERLRDVWQGLEAGSGEFKEIIDISAQRQLQYRCVYVTCEFEKARHNFKVVLDGKNQVGGLWVEPVRTAGR